MKNKNLKLIALSIFAVALVSFGTYALWDLGEGLFTTENTITSGQVSMSFSEKNEITLSNALPMSDTDGKLLDEYFDFSLSTYIKTNANDSTPRKSYYNVLLEKLSPTTNTTALQDSEIKVYLTEVASNGSETQILAPTTIDKLSNYLLTSGSEEFKNNKSRVEKNYRLRVWIDFQVDANKFNGTTAYSYNFRVNINNEEPINLDTSKANTPDLLTNMIPVYYNETCNNNAGCWEKADSTNTEEAYQWYNYDEKMWANAVTVEATNRSTYINAPIGTEILMTDINSMWVWIPRYTYTYFASNTPTSIQIEFEQGTGSNGTITCTDDVRGMSDGTQYTTSQTCTDRNTTSLVAGQSTYTHPAFNFGGTQLEGFWMGKFENSATANIPTATSTEEHTIVIKPDVQSLRYKAVSYLFTDVRQMEKANNIYGFEQSSSTTFNLDGTLTGDTNNIDTHMLKNIEWGAVAYLSHSKYGINKEININNSGVSATGYYTGRSGGNVGGSVQTQADFYGSDVTTDTKVYNDYGYYTYDGSKLNYGTNTKSAEKDISTIASTTGNIYGVYDMSGGIYEYVMGNMVDSTGAFRTSSAGQWSATTKPLVKYYDSYTYYGSEGDTVYTRGRLGDATVEMAPTGIRGNWYSDYAYFVYSSNSWFLRGGYAGAGANAGAFYFYNLNGSASRYGSRSSLCVLN